MRRVPGLLLLAVAVVVTAASAGAAAERDAGFQAALESIVAADFTRHVGYLASPQLAGREAGSAGGRQAGEYVRDRLKALGIAGGAAEGDYFQPFAPNYRNVLGVITGRDPQLKNEYVVVGAHYDHVGRGNRRNSHGPIGYIHPGADDNASGTASVLELAEALTLLPNPPRRSVLLIFFDAEELGLFGSKHWVEAPTVPLDRVVTMVNVDMIGRVREGELEIYGTRSAPGLRRLVCEQNDVVGFSLAFPWRLVGEADHFSFYESHVPVIALHSQMHDDYHTPRDTPDKLNTPDMTRAGRLLFSIVEELANRDGRPAWRDSADHETDAARRSIESRTSRLPDRLGVAWEDEGQDDRGLRVTRVAPASAAETAGIRPGDRIVRFADQSVASGDDLRGAVAGAASATLAFVRRAGEKELLKLQVPLAGEPMRLGITWRVDPAEEGAIIVNYVVPHSPATEAGLQVGDRIYQAAGHDFADDHEFAARVAAAGESIQLLIERHGHIQVIVVDLAGNRASLRRAA